MNAPKIDPSDEQEKEDRATAPALPAAEVDAGVSIARRRALLKGLGKGAALAGAATPLSSLAGSGQRMKLVTATGNVVLCSVSGNMSVLVSASTASLPQCTGSQISSYQSTTSASTTKTATATTSSTGSTVSATSSGTTATTGTYAKWPSEAVSKSYLPATSFKSVFGVSVPVATSSGVKAEATLGYLIDLKPPTDESYWVMALLNACRDANYPYSPTDVITQYQNAGKRSAALAFHKMVAGYA